MNNSLTEEQVKVLNMSQSVINEVRKVIIGKDEIIIKVLLSILAGGHILIEDIPGVGKTTLAVALSKALSLDYKRLQFTPDVLPLFFMFRFSQLFANRVTDYQYGVPQLV